MRRERDKLISVRINSDLYKQAMNHLKNNEWENRRLDKPITIGDILTIALINNIKTT